MNESKGKITILDYLIFSYTMNELEYHLFVMNRNPTYKCNLVSIIIIFYFIPTFIKKNESEFHLFAMNRNPTYKCNLVSIIIIFLFIPTFIKFIRTWNEEENNYDVYYHSSFLCTKQPFKVLA